MIWAFYCPLTRAIFSLTASNTAPNIASMNEKTRLNREWRDAKRAQGYVQKLVWVLPEKWALIQALIRAATKVQHEHK